MNNNLNYAIVAIIGSLIFGACTAPYENTIAESSENVSDETVYTTTYRNECITQSSFDTVENNNSTNIEISSELTNELTKIIDCYYAFEDLVGGRYIRCSDNCEIRMLNEDYSDNHYNFSSEIKYYEFETDEEFYLNCYSLFFRNDNDLVFSSSIINKEDYDNLALSYFTEKFYSNKFCRIFEDVIEDDYVLPSRYWIFDGKLLINSSLDYMYGGTNDYSSLTVNNMTEDYIDVTIIRKYQNNDSSVEFAFIQNDNLWKIDSIEYLN